MLPKEFTLIWNNRCLHATNWIRHRTADNLIITIGCVTKFQLIDLFFLSSLLLGPTKPLKAQQYRRRRRKVVIVKLLVLRKYLNFALTAILIIRIYAQEFFNR